MNRTLLAGLFIFGLGSVPMLQAIAADAAVAAPAPTIETVTAERDALKAQVADLQLAVQALRQQRDAATQALQDAQAQAAIDNAKKQQATTPPAK